MDELEALIATRAAELLIDNYFNRIHWFMLIFHQSDFRDRFQQLHAAGKWKQGAVQQRSGFLSVCLAVCLVSLRYTSPEQQQHLSALGVPPPRLQEQLLATLRQRILDIVSLGSIEAVQTCVLLGSFYLYHGVPELAWPICGCGLRIAQALNLHRQIREQQQPIVDLDDPTQRAEETRKRCWWAVYEIDTFCSMLYGYPLGITDSDCDVQLLNAYAASEKNSTWGSVESQRAHGQATLLSYKRCMAELSIIVKSALTGLYALHRRGSEETTRASRLKDLAATVKSLDTRLGDWYRSLPVKLQWGEHPETSAHVHASESEVGLHARLFQLQTLALKLAFENARILIHRPYISFRTVQNSHSQPDKNPGPPLDICWSSIESCRDAALQISRVGTSPVAKEAADTYALSFVSVHLFTAGVTLSIIASLRPLAPQSQEAKLGLRRLMGMQSLLKAKSIVAEQGFQILCKLTRLVMQKETSTMLDFDETGPGDPVTSTEANKASNKDGEWLPPSQDQLHVATNGPAQTSESMAQPRDQATPQFELHQDPTVAQALLDFEQGVCSIPWTFTINDARRLTR